MRCAQRCATRGAKDASWRGKRKRYSRDARILRDLSARRVMPLPEARTSQAFTYAYAPRYKEAMLFFCPFFAADFLPLLRPPGYFFPPLIMPTDMPVTRYALLGLCCLLPFLMSCPPADARLIALPRLRRHACHAYFFFRFCRHFFLIAYFSFILA